MRTLIALAALLILTPDVASARTAIEFGLLNSDFTFGLIDPDQAGWDLYYFDVKGGRPTPWQMWDGTYDAYTGALVGQTLTMNAGGLVTGSRYHYEGGLFLFDIALWKSGVFRRGLFVAEILSLDVVVNEVNDNVEAYYSFGRGLFDANLARALGIRRRTEGGELYSGLELTDFGNRGGIGGDHTTPIRQAWDGYAEGYLRVAVPEPSVALMLLAGAAWLRRRRSN
jgi:hypothetical protein